MKNHSVKHWNKREIFVKSAMGAVLVTAMLAAAGCAKSADTGKLLDEAASRAEGEKSEYTYIDDEAIAKAGEVADTDNSEMVDQTIALVNKERSAAGLSALDVNQGLEQCAEVRAVECATSYSHTRPDGSDWWTVNSDLMYGENLASNYTTAQAVVNAWMASPAHKANIMNSGYSTIGLATYTTESGDVYWAEEFGY